MASIKFTLNGKQQAVDVAPDMPLPWGPAGHLGADRHQIRLRHGIVRRMHGSH